MMAIMRLPSYEALFIFGASLPSEHWLSVCWAASGFVVVGGSMHAWIAGDMGRREKELRIKKVLLRVSVHHKKLNSWSLESGHLEL